MATCKFQVTLGADSPRATSKLLLRALLTLCSQKELGYLAHFASVYQHGIFGLQPMKKGSHEDFIHWI